MAYWFRGSLCQGSDIALAVDEPAFLYGATAFTTLRVYGHSLDHPLTAWSAHQARLTETLQTFGWATPNWSQVRQGAALLLREYALLRITCFPNGRELVSGRHLPADLDQIQAQGIAAWVAHGELYQRPVPGHKTGNYLGAWLASQAAQGQGAREAILLDAQGHWLETSTGNLWGWANGRWHTPGLGAGLLPGIVRTYLIDYLRQRGERVEQSPWPPGVIPRFEVLAYSNSGVQIVPIHTVLGDRSRLEVNPKHPALEALRAAFREN
ncbi:aminotransferase class IV [Nodosilinea nodulosa]|uniref:aminotransferase class IV n=1 Tax=Nodosilinea nodulosa TaxID=416001 RepID=UPI0002E11322|nr:aminotransferase class IV [Nodosilinea nodulosa]